MLSFLLKTYLRLHEYFHSNLIYKLSKPLFNGLHPKNHFHFRSEFFLENSTPDDTILDIACGTGLISYNLASKVRRVYAIERDKSNLEFCRNKFSRSNLEYIEGDLFDIDYNELKYRTRYTTAVFSHILEHIEDPIDIIRRVAADKILICVPSQENWYRQLLIHLNLPYRTDKSHFREYTRIMLRSELERSGYRVVFIGFNAEGEIISRADRISS